MKVENTSRNEFAQGKILIRHDGLPQDERRRPEPQVAATLGPCSGMYPAAVLRLSFGVPQTPLLS